MKRTDWIKRASGLFVPQPLRFAPGYPCCCGGLPTTTCSDCDDGVRAQYLEVTISGMASRFSSGQAPYCADCADLDGTYILTAAGLSGCPDTCAWSYTIESVCPIPSWFPNGYIRIGVLFYTQLGTTTILGFITQTANCPSSSYAVEEWYEDGDYSDCLSWSEISLTHKRGYGGSFGTVGSCKNDDATFTVSVYNPND